MSQKTTSKQTSGQSTPDDASAIDLHNLSEPLLQRLQQLEALNGYDQCFHRAVPNNYVYMLINASYPLEDYLAGIATNTAPLNRANGRVYRYCVDKVKELPRQAVLGNDELIQWLGGWKKTTTTSVNLKGVAFAEKVFAFLADAGLDARRRWRTEAPEMHDMFTRQIPHKIEHLLRLNLSIPHDLVTQSLQRLMDEVFGASDTFSLIERVEVAKPNLSNDTSVTNYPTIILYLVVDANEPARRDEVDQLLRLLHPWAAGFEHGLGAESDFADLWYPFLTVTQGYKLWKRYLRVVGLLDEVYDRDFNYAYLRGRPTLRNFPQVLSQYRP